MSTKNKPQNAAVAKFTTHGVKPIDIAGMTNQVSTTIKAHPDYPNHPEIQTPVAKWITQAQLVGTIQQKIAACHAELATLEGQQTDAVVEWKRDTRIVVAAVDGAAGGSPTAITQWGLEVVTRVAPPPSTDPPVNLRVGLTKSHAFTIRWKAIKNARGYLLQIGDGTPSGWGTILQSTKATYVPTGLTSGQHIAVRVAVIRKNGQSAWSDVLNAVVR